MLGPSLRMRQKNRVPPWGFIPELKLSNKYHMYEYFIVFNVFPGFKWSPFFFLNIFKLNLDERHLACGLKCTLRN